MLLQFLYRRDQNDRVDAAEAFSGQEMAGISVEILKKYSKKLKTMKKRVDSAKRQIDAAKKEVDAVKEDVDDMDSMVDSAIESLQTLS